MTTGLARYAQPDTFPALCCGEDMKQHANGELECEACGHTLPADHLTSDDHDFELTGDIEQQSHELGEAEDDEFRS